MYFSKIACWIDDLLQTQNDTSTPFPYTNIKIVTHVVWDIADHETK